MFYLGDDYMCGIIGCISERKAAPIVLDALKNLEYRGYDSVGIATLTDKINIKKGSGEIDTVDELLDLKDMEGTIGIGHVRWATHGNPTTENAHPHCDCNGKISVVHNGIIGNYKELKKELEEEGHKFKSQTDTEVIPHLIEKYMAEGNDYLTSIKMSLERLVGSYALAIINTDEPDKIIGAKNESPLIVGISDKGNFLASDIPAILSETKEVMYIDNKELIVLTKDSAEVWLKKVDMLISC